jgi:hypothetical protein
MAPRNPPNIKINDTAPASNPEHDKLVEILKFTPRTYKIQLYGYGGEVAMGRIEQKIWDYFRDNRINVEDYAWDSDYGEEAVPEEFQPFYPGSWYDCDNIARAYGVSKSAGTIEITDEQDQTVLQRDTSGIDGFDIQIDGEVEAYIHAESEKGPIFYGYSSEKGVFFEGEIYLTQPFDQDKLKLIVEDIDGEDLITQVFYDEEEIDNFGSNTNGKGSSFFMYNMVDGEVVSYVSGEDVDENFDDGTPPVGQSPESWESSPKVKKGNPKLTGYYSCNYSNGSTWGILYWNNERNLWEDYYHGRITSEYKTVNWWQGYNWDTSDWANRPQEPVDTQCNNKKCGWVGKRDDMRQDEEYYHHCPECDGTDWDWIEYDPDTAKGRKNRAKHVKGA